MSLKSDISILERYGIKLQDVSSKFYISTGDQIWDLIRDKIECNHINGWTDVTMTVVSSIMIELKLYLNGYVEYKVNYNYSTDTEVKKLVIKFVNSHKYTLSKRIYNEQQKEREQLAIKQIETSLFN